MTGRPRVSNWVDISIIYISPNTRYLNAITNIFQFGCCLNPRGPVYGHPLSCASWKIQVPMCFYACSFVGKNHIHFGVPNKSTTNPVFFRNIPVGCSFMQLFHVFIARFGPSNSGGDNQVITQAPLDSIALHSKETGC